MIGKIICIITGFIAIFFGVMLISSYKKFIYQYKNRLGSSDYGIQVRFLKIVGFAFVLIGVLLSILSGVGIVMDLLSCC
ncbi:hypothetical protein [Marispirochaeta sp.]|uniref:hypothetical protein n=1 Tax=Marispirochaeta sp. TaxID=2038653 RepID=UPI0029C85BE0|nr:hypothetical protein [Marispirochaeta sp.]